MPKRRFYLMFFISQAELDAKTFYQHNMRILTTIRRTRCIFLVVRETGEVYVPGSAVYQSAIEEDLTQMVFDDLHKATESVNAVESFAQAIAVNKNDKTVRYCGRNPEVSVVFFDRMFTKVEVHL
ncbi:hypothetical protein pEaSNUABM14_00263 [Erwinia phage pEa_SNUABM_14]|uniref:Uncharacterized protein n=1 Tax=Erwinia phage pEa_SNUABM_7 TaxID=2866695 RepID=A0AAE8BLK3_9CAUD|nr:hypothetical protein MPK74_gp264 [Erwinia phage pEa_SNUABM_7]QYW04588.1 hypothetical protein pEaSNUABM14_00263 [Erwinia phage pEa_SNUABM_14]QYW04932.1 hypothetical protein pEaSNUABM7_00264 [Erwinia phage pEa_SNUABM_7]